MLRQTQSLADFMFYERLYANSLYEYAKAVWPLIEGKPFIDNWHVRDICEHLEAVTYGQIRNIIFNLPPRTTKTSLICVVWPTWCWISRPYLQFLVVANGENLAKKGAVDSQNIITSLFYRERWGKVYQLSPGQREKFYYTNNRHGYRRSTTIRSTIIGGGGDIVIADDFNSPYESETERQFVKDFFYGTLFNRVNDPKLSSRVILQQRTAKLDLTGDILAGEGAKDWVHFYLPMEYDTERKCRTIILPSTKGKPWEDPRTKPGELLWPERFGKQELDTIKRGIGTHIYAGQYQQTPKDEEGGIILRRWWRPWREKYRPKLLYLLQSWDTALTDKETSAYSACTTWGLFADERGVPNIIPLSAWRGRVGGPEVLRRAIRMSNNYLDTGEVPREYNELYRPNIVVVEEKASGYQLVSDLIERGIPAHGFNPTKYGDKVARAHQCTPYIECGYGWVPTRAPDSNQLRQEIEMFVDAAAMFPNGDGADLVDTFTQAILYLKEKGMLRHPDEVAFLADSVEDKQRPGYRKENEKEFQMVAEIKAGAEERGAKFLMDPFAYIMEENDDRG